MIEINQLIHGKYRIERILGQGAMGIVVRALHQQLRHAVALKLLLPTRAIDPVVVERFMREARAAAMLTSEHVCRIYDVGMRAGTGPYIVMEYMDGVDVAALLRDRGPLSPGLAVDIVLQVCEALAEAHSHGIVHRDLKPANLFMTRRADGSPLIKLLDFGVSKLPVPDAIRLTHSHVIVGTPAYMSPEQLRHSNLADHRSDIWSLGVVLHELVSGRLPFHAPSFSELCCQILMLPQPPIARLPRGLEDVVIRCLQKLPGDRFDDIAELAGALAPYAQTPRVAAITRERTARILEGHGQRAVTPHAADRPTRSEPVGLPD